MNRIKRYLSIKREQNARALLLLGIIMFNVLLWFGSSVLAYVIAPGTYGNVAGALWESGITWMLEPGFYDPATDVSIRIISIVVIITSMITFSGGIIAYMASLFASVIDAARQGRNKAYLYDHILILNWNHKALELINDYGHDDETTTVVIMSDREKEEIERNLKRKLTENRHRGQKRLNIIVRQGDVFSKSDLEDVSASRARAVIVLSDEEAARGQMTYHKDILAMKTVMLVCSLETTIEQTVIVEIKDPDSAALIKNKIGKETPGNIHILTIMPDELMGRLIAQTLLMPALNNVYQELFSFDGAEFYAIEERDVKDYLLTHDKAIPIYTLEGKTYVLAENRDDIHSLRRIGPADPKPLKIRSYTRYQPLNLVIFGTNRKLDYILDSIRLFERENQAKVEVTMVSSNDAKTIREQTGAIDKIDTILILSEDFLMDQDVDSEVLVTLLMIQDVARQHSAEIVIELLDPRHVDIAQGYNIKNTIISNKYISRLMTQLSKDRYLYPLYEDLLTYDEDDAEDETYEVYTYHVESIFENPLPLTFGSASDLILSGMVSGNHEFVIIGVIKDGFTRIFKGQLDTPETLILEQGDMIVAICK